MDVFERIILFGKILKVKIDRDTESIKKEAVCGLHLSHPQKLCHRGVGGRV